MITSSRPSLALDGPIGELFSHSSKKSGSLSKRISLSRRTRRSERSSFVDLVYISSITLDEIVRSRRGSGSDSGVNGDNVGIGRGRGEGERGGGGRGGGSHFFFFACFSRFAINYRVCLSSQALLLLIIETPSFSKGMRGQWSNG